MKIAIIGTGYVGLVTGTCLAESGNQVCCIDIDQNKIDRLRNGIIPIYEPGLEELVRRNTKEERLTFTTDLAKGIQDARIVFIAVGTPQSMDGSADLGTVFHVARLLAETIETPKIVAIKSTVPVGTNAKVAEILKSAKCRVDSASNPEFLKEGAAIADFSKPDRVVVGVRDLQVAEELHNLYRPFLRTERPFLVMSPESAEMTKYVANAMLATKISFINEMANLCETVQADINDVRKGIGHDERIGFQFLFPGAGYGGSCFPKDIRAVIHMAKDHGLPSVLMSAVDEVNEQQKCVLFQKLKRHFGDSLAGKTVAIWGLSFKPRTDDIREAPALSLIRELLEIGCPVRVHDPVALNNVRELFGDKLSYSTKPMETVEGANALVICTEWKEFQNPDFSQLCLKLSDKLIIDGRNLYNADSVTAAGLTYDSIGRAKATPGQT
ncbi:MAG: UDP-glucose/GDP-mannose dehydrogenase family protein [Planctomycetota bacterium]|nr:UDP-glucose/GDP-mannose dehydrogenase family protein [Planctomycetota bacterium]